MRTGICQGNIVLNRISVRDIFAEITSGNGFVQAGHSFIQGIDCFFKRID